MGNFKLPPHQLLVEQNFDSELTHNLIYIVTQNDINGTYTLFKVDDGLKLLKIESSKTPFFETQRWNAL